MKRLPKQQRAWMGNRGQGKYVFLEMELLQQHYDPDKKGWDVGAKLALAGKYTVRILQ